MKSNYYMVSEETLMALLMSDYRLAMLEEAGVYEEDWYCNAMMDFLERFTDDNGVPSFADLARKDLTIFRKVDEN